jgi:rare lipoprotein A
MLKFAIGLTPAALMLSVAIFVLMTIGGFACSPARVSWYGHESCVSSPCRTATGERFTGEDMTAASLTLPFGARLIVQNVRNGRSVQVRINDRGPYIRGRAMDLSKAAFAKIAQLGQGTARVCLERVG